MATASQSDRSERLQLQLKALPDTPGVYLFHGASDEVLYVGKAKSLRKRVQSYFRGGYAIQRTAELVERIAEIEVFVVTSETEALLLEQNLIKRHRPMFNIRLRDDKSYPYIAVTVGDEYPRVMFTRERHRKGVQYFGPYSSARKVRETLDVLNRVFPYRPCEGPTPGRRSGVPCLDYHIGRCGAPCVGYVSKQEYGTVIDSVIEFLSGRVRPLERDLEKAMQEAAESRQYEEAARYRNRLTAVRHLSETQVADKRSLGSADVLAVAVAGDNANVQLFHLRDGRLADRQSFYLENTEGEDESEALWGFALEYYGGHVAIPAQVVVPRSFPDAELLEAFLGERRGATVEVRAAQRGEKRRIAELASQNATLALEHDALLAQRSRARRVEALEELRERLNLEKLPVRIECFDVSNLGDTNTVASMVVFEDAVAKRSHYRSFTIRHGKGQDDFSSMREAVSRRFARMRAVEADRYDESFAATPSLVVIDGGKGQLNAALDAMAEFDLPRVAVISLAKRIEEVFIPGRPDPIMLDPASNGLQLLQRVRDEAHRFALGRHRKRRARSSVESIFDSLPGVGPARKRLLIEHFGTPERFVSATRDELESVPGLPAKVARQIHQSLHKAGKIAVAMDLFPEQTSAFEPAPSRRRRGVRVVCLGGGTGLSMILRGLKRIASVTAVVTTTDDGGSSGRLRRDFGMPAPGDLRSCLTALAEDESLVGQLFQHRFTTGELAGHSFGNLFLAGMTDMLGSFDQAVSESARVLAVRGRVVPSTTDLVELVAHFADGRVVRGETALAADGAQCQRVELDPPDPVAHPRALQAIERAELVVMGPGSLYTSTIPPLLVPGIREAVRAVQVPKIYVCNLLQQPGETEGYRASDHVARIIDHCGEGLVDAVLVSRNRAEQGTPVPVDRGGLRRLGVRVFGARLAGEWQHDQDKLARTLVRLSRWDPRAEGQ